MADERGYSRVAPGVYVNAKGEVKIHLKEASDDDGSGLNLAPKAPDLSDKQTLAITAAAWGRINEAVESGRSAS